MANAWRCFIDTFQKVPEKVRRHQVLRQKSRSRRAGRAATDTPRGIVRGNASPVKRAARSLSCARPRRRSRARLLASRIGVRPSHPSRAREKPRGKGQRKSRHRDGRPGLRPRGSVVQARVGQGRQRELRERVQSHAPRHHRRGEGDRKVRAPRRRASVRHPPAIHHPIVSLTPRNARRKSRM